MNASDFDTAFENDEDVLEYLDLESVRRPMRQSKRVNVDFPVWMVEQLDREAARLGVTRQSVIKFWISERIKPVHN
jgi:hypothetical protein